MSNINTGVKVKPYGSDTQASRRFKGGFWLVVLGAALWGVDPLFRVILLKNLTSAQIVLLEHIIISLIAIPVLWKNREELKGLGWSHVGALLFISWGGSALATVLFTMGLSSGNLNAVLFASEAATAVCHHSGQPASEREASASFRRTAHHRVGGHVFTDLRFNLADWPLERVYSSWQSLVLRCGGAVGRFNRHGAPDGRQTEIRDGNLARFVLALPLLTVITWSEGAWNMPAWNTGAFALVSLNLIGQALLPGLLSLLVYYKGLTTTKASVATLAELSFPMVGVLINWIVFQQIVTGPQLLGFLLIWVVLFIISRQQSEASPQLQ